MAGDLPNYDGERRPSNVDPKLATEDDAAVLGEETLVLSIFRVSNTL